MIFTNGYFLWNAVVLSGHVREIRLRTRITTVPDNDVMGTIAEKVVPVLEGYDLEVVFRQDFAASGPEQTLAVDHKGKVARAWAARPDAGAISTTNPEYQGTGIITEYEPIHGAFGEVLGTRAVIMPTVGGVTRDTTP